MLDLLVSIQQWLAEPHCVGHWVRPWGATMLNKVVLLPYPRE